MKPPSQEDLDLFLNPECKTYWLDCYHPKASVLAAVKNALPHFSGTVLDIGCGVMPYKPLFQQSTAVTRYLGLDLENNTYGKPDVTWNGVNIPLEANSIDSAFATEVLEHCPDPLQFLSEANRVLKPGAFFLLTVPFLWPLHDMPYDEFRYTPSSLQRLAIQAGFEVLEIRSTGGWDSSLASLVGLWILRRPGLSPLTRRVLGAAALPICRWLYKADRTDSDVHRNGMFTGFAMHARKRQDIQL